MPLQYRALSVSDFTGGMTDDFINAPENTAEVLENFIILENKTLLTRFGTELDVKSDINSQIPLGAQEITALINYDVDDTLIYNSGRKFYFRNPEAFTSLTGPDASDPFPAGHTVANFLSQTQWNRHLILCSDATGVKPQKIYKDDAGVLQVRTAGMPELASSPVVTPGAGANNYIYAFHYSYTYMVGDQEFQDEGPVTEIEVTNADAPDSTTVNITGIPVLANSGVDNYDTANIKVEIFRTTNNGVVLLKIGEVTNGTTIFNDSFADSAIENNATIYTDGDVPNNDPPPVSRFCHSVNGFTYYAFFEEGGETFPSKYRQSQALDPDSVPKSFVDEVEDDITGLSSVQEVPIVFGTKHVYRVDGTYDVLGRGGMNHIRISDHAGCISNESAVQAEGRLYWAGNDGFYTTDGFRVEKITDHLNARYRNFVGTYNGKTRKIKGVFDEERRMIHWTMSRNSKVAGQEQNDTIWTVDLRYGVSTKMTCHLWIGGTFQPTALAVFNKELYRGDPTGYTLVFKESVFTDPKINSVTAQSTWAEEAIRWTYRSSATDFGAPHVRKVSNKLLTVAKNITNISIQPVARNDDGQNIRNFAEIRFRRNFIWGDEEFIWGNPDFVWYKGGLIQTDRRFPKNGLRYNYLQIEYTNAFTNIVNSDLLGQATVNGVANTVTLDDAANADWPSQSIDYVISLEQPTFDKQFTVTGRTDDTLTLDDPSGEPVDGSHKWQLKGYRKGEIINLVSWTAGWAFTSRSHGDFNVGDAGNLS